MKQKLLSLCAAVLVLAACGGQKTGQVIELPVPERPAGQQDMIQFAADPIENVGVGVVGLGMRGSHAVRRLMLVPGCHIAAICDVETDRAESSLADVREGGQEANVYSGEEESYKALCEDPDVDLVYICTDWLHHVPVALYALEHGKHVAIEVPSALTLKDCWDLINTSERTRRHCMILENCCYDFFELSALAMAQAGVFGEIIHAEGAYNHNLGPFWYEYWENWRLDYNSKHRGDLYPTHGFGPVCQVLNIHRGDRLTTLVAMDTDPFNGPKHAKEAGMDNTDFKEGDVTMTMLRTEKGKTILIEHDVMTARPYSRMYQLVGTDGYAEKYPIEGICLPEGNSEKTYRGAEMEALMAKYPSPILTPELEETAKRVGGHGGMDYTMDYRLIYCLNHGLPLDMDVYDLAEWCSVAELSRISLENGSAPVAVPDFTRGAWNKVNGYSYAFAK
ncbi:MAG: Gfo/Idh/MocA family oxidoreductase [Bacteroidales bacterium]|jgi:predicted dehydrogenase|nr:Gfo/Idh/MocA family oxidoreductase [Bacteroidales bacterium]